MDASPYFTVLRARQRVPAQDLRRRRRHLVAAAVLRQLLRPARLRRDGRRHPRNRPVAAAAATTAARARSARSQRSSTGSTAARPQRIWHGRAVRATWANGTVGMIGKSYDGTLAEGVAATGVDGLDDHRPDLGDRLLVRLLALARRRSTRGTTSRRCSTRSAVDRTASRPCARLVRRAGRRRDRRLQRVLEGTRLPARVGPGARQCLRLARRQRRQRADPSTWPRGGPGSEQPACRASSG